MYQLQSGGTNYHDITSGKSGSNKAGPGYDLVTGLGSPIANNLVPALITLNTPPAPAKSTGAPAGVATASHLSASISLVITSDPSTGATTIATTTGSTSTTTSTSITPLNPNSTSATSTSSVVTVFIVPPPLAPIVIHLGSSASPVTLQAINSPLAALEEQPTALTHFGQSLETELQKLFLPRLAPEPSVAPWIDVVEPFQPLDPAEAPKDDLAPAKGASRTWSAPLLLEPDSELTGRGGLPGAAAAPADRDGARAATGFSMLVGVAAVAAGGYQFAMRESDRFRVRWLPRRTSSDRSARPRIPSR